MPSASSPCALVAGLLPAANAGRGSEGTLGFVFFSGGGGVPYGGGTVNARRKWNLSAISILKGLDFRTQLGMYQWDEREGASMYSALGGF